MKTFVYAVALLIATPLLAQAQMVSVYTDDFSGSHVDLAVGKYDYKALAVNGANNIASFKVPAGLKVTLYTKDNFEGNSLVITKDASPQYLQSKGFGSSGLIMPSMVIEKASMQPTGPYVTIYKDNFSGESDMLAPGQYEFTEWTFGNDKLSSVKIPKGLKVKLYENEAFQGRSLELTSDASADFLVKNKFNDLASSIIVEVVPDPVKTETPVIVVLPVVVPVVEEKTVVVADKQPATNNNGEPVVTIYEGDFSGASKDLTPGKYSFDHLGIGNDQLSSVRIPKGFRVTLFENDAFDGRSLVLTQDIRAEDMVDKQFNNVTSSVIVQSISMVTIYEGDYTGARRVLDPGKYKGVDIGIANVSSVKVPEGFKVTLFEKDNFAGRSLVLTHDTGTDFLARNNFDNLTSSLVVETAPVNVPMVTLFKGDYSGNSAQFPVGRYDFRDGGYEDNAVGSIHIPRGLQVTLYENGSFRGRSMVVRANTGIDFFKENQFDGIATSMVVEEVPASELFVTLYEQVNSGLSEKLGPGRYNASDLRIGNDRISSVKVPKGMRVTLHEDENFLGRSMTFEHDGDLTISQVFDNRTSSVIVEDIFTPIVTPVAETTTTVVPAVVVTQVPVTTEAQAVVTVPPCEMTSQQYDNAVKAVQSKAFRDEKMDMAQLATKGKCMTNNQIRGIAKLFSFEDQTLEFVKYAYDLSNEKSEYYTLNDLFKFMSSQNEFTAFLKER